MRCKRCARPSWSIRRGQRRLCRALLAVLSAGLLGLVLPPGSAVAGTAHIGRPIPAPVATTEAGAATSPVKALVSVAIDPLGILTRYSVQYGTTAAYGSATASKTIWSAGTNTYQVSLDDLLPSTVYHYRVVASNLLGSTQGRDATVSTWPVQIPFLSKGVVSANNVISMPRTRRGQQRPLGWVLAIHGGGWQTVGRAAVTSEDSLVRFATGLGWAADNVDYRKGEHSLPDVLAAFDALRKRVGVKTPICLAGDSAGGHLALLAAEYRRSVDCVISEAGPTDLLRFRHQRTYAPSPPQRATYSANWAYEEFIVPSFGVEPSVLREWSPVRRAGKLRARVLLGGSTFDEMVPLRQMTELRAAMRPKGAPGTIRIARLAGANTPSGHAANFTHASITKAAAAEWQRDVRQLLARVARHSHRSA